MEVNIQKIFERKFFNFNSLKISSNLTPASKPSEKRFTNGFKVINLFYCGVTINKKSDDSMK